MITLPNTRALLPTLPYRVRNMVNNWIVRGVPAGVKAVVANDELYKALKSDLASDATHTS